MRLEWAESEFTCVSGEHPRLGLNLVNAGRKPFVADIGRPCAFASLVEASTGERVPNVRGMAIAGVGWHVVLPAGAHTDVGVVLMTDRPQELRPGLYLVSAGLHALDLEAPSGQLRVREGDPTP